MITHDYLSNILSPFDGKTLRMRSTTKELTKGLVIETAIESPFNFRCDGMGIAFYVKGSNYYVNQNLADVFRKGLRDALGSVYKLENAFESNTFDIILNSMRDNLEVNIGRIYYASIDVVEVNKNGFKINGIDFVIAK